MSDSVSAQGETLAPTFTAAILIAAILATGCHHPSRCGPARAHQVDVDLAHLAPGAPEPAYLDDPPTSGPHVAGLRVVGRHDEPINNIAQVSSLEAGVVIVQHQGLDGPERADLESLASAEVAVAPGVGLPSRIVVTAWAASLRCTALDRQAVEAFIEDRRGKAPAQHPR